MGRYIFVCKCSESIPSWLCYSSLNMSCQSCLVTSRSGKRNHKNHEKKTVLLSMLLSNTILFFVYMNGSLGVKVLPPFGSLVLLKYKLVLANSPLGYIILELPVSKEFSCMTLLFIMYNKRIRLHIIR